MIGPLVSLGPTALASGGSTTTARQRIFGGTTRVAQSHPQSNSAAEVRLLRLIGEELVHHLIARVAGVRCVLNVPVEGVFEQGTCLFLTGTVAAAVIRFLRERDAEDAASSAIALRTLVVVSMSVDSR